MNDLMVFQNVEFGQIRMLDINGDPWFVGKDIADALGYERSTKAVQDHVDAEDKDEIPIQDSIGRMQNTPIINESGLYSLILSSKLPNAKTFKRWVTSEVLPSIRKTGGYIPTSSIDSDADIMARALVIANKTLEERDRRLAQLNDTVESLEIALNESLEWWTVAKYNEVHNMGWNMPQVQYIGKRLTAYCLARAITPRVCKTNDERFNKTNSYPVTVWEDFMRREYAWMLFPKRKTKKKR